MEKESRYYFIVPEIIYQKIIELNISDHKNSGATEYI